MTLLAALFALVLVAGSGSASGTAFPGARGEARSPIGSWTLRWIPADKTVSGEHALVLVTPNGTTRQVLSFPRHVTVAWAPDGRRFAVTNYIGSTDAEASVYSVAQEDAVSVAGLLEAQRPDVLRPAAGADHRYVEVVSWEDSQTLLVRVWGYGGGRGYDKRCRVRLSE